MSKFRKFRKLRSPSNQSLCFRVINIFLLPSDIPCSGGIKTTASWGQSTRKSTQDANKGMHQLQLMQLQSIVKVSFVHRVSQKKFTRLEGCRIMPPIFKTKTLIYQSKVNKGRFCNTIASVGLVHTSIQSD